jgi:hypothetical protein
MNNKKGHQTNKQTDSHREMKIHIILCGATHNQDDDE